MIGVDTLIKRTKVIIGSVATLLNVSRDTFPQIICKSVILMEKSYTQENDSYVCHPSLL